MNRTRNVLLLAVLICAVVILRPGTTSSASPTVPAAAATLQAESPAPTISSVADGEISGIEKEIVAAAEAIPEDKFNFSPESMKIPGSEYKGVRTFAGQVKHGAVANHFLWAPLTGDTVPDGWEKDNAPENLKSKAEIVQFLKESFALGHKAAATLTAENILQSPGHSKSTRLFLATFGVAHAYDHYGQLVEYLRMNGIVPPPSRGGGK